MLLPVRYDYGVAVFRLEDVNIYGLPDLFGYDDYLVTSTYEDESPYVLDFHDEQGRRLVPIHRYSRLARFKGIVYQLLGERGNIPEEVLEVVKYWGYDDSPVLVWNSVRNILKTYGNF